MNLHGNICGTLIYLFTNLPHTPAHRRVSPSYRHGHYRKISNDERLFQCLFRSFIDPDGKLWGLTGLLTRCLHLDHQGEQADEKEVERKQWSTTQTLQVKLCSHCPLEHVFRRHFQWSLCKHTFQASMFKSLAFMCHYSSFWGFRYKTLNRWWKLSQAELWTMRDLEWNVSPLINWIVNSWKTTSIVFWNRSVKEKASSKIYRISPLWHFAPSLSPVWTHHAKSMWMRWNCVFECMSHELSIM